MAYIDSEFFNEIEMNAISKTKLRRMTQAFADEKAALELAAATKDPDAADRVVVQEETIATEELPATDADVQEEPAAEATDKASTETGASG